MTPLIKLLISIPTPVLPTTQWYPLLYLQMQLFTFRVLLSTATIQLILKRIAAIPLFLPLLLDYFLWIFIYFGMENQIMPHLLAHILLILPPPVLLFRQFINQILLLFLQICRLFGCFCCNLVVLGINWGQVIVLERWFLEGILVLQINAVEYLEVLILRHSGGIKILQVGGCIVILFELFLFLVGHFQ